jgi:hypothetical protein
MSKEYLKLYKISNNSLIKVTFDTFFEMCVCGKKIHFGKVQFFIFFLPNAKIIFARNKSFSVKVLYFLIWRLITKIIFCKNEKFGGGEKLFVELCFLNNFKNSYKIYFELSFFFAPPNF